MTKLNEITKQKLKKIYSELGCSFSDLSFSKESKKSCVESEAKAINGDRLKENCLKCKKLNKIKSVDAISFNKNRFIFMEFKIKNLDSLKKSSNTLLKNLCKKFDDSWKCFQHNIDTECLYSKTNQEKIFVYKIRDKVRDSTNFFNSIRDKLKENNIKAIRSENFEKNICFYEYKLN